MLRNSFKRFNEIFITLLLINDKFLDLPLVLHDFMWIIKLFQWIHDFHQFNLKI